MIRAQKKRLPKLLTHLTSYASVMALALKKDMVGHQIY